MGFHFSIASTSDPLLLFSPPLQFHASTGLSRTDSRKNWTVIELVSCQETGEERVNLYLSTFYLRNPFTANSRLQKMQEVNVFDIFKWKIAVCGCAQSWSLKLNQECRETPALLYTFHLCRYAYSWYLPRADVIHYANSICTFCDTARFIPSFSLICFLLIRRRSSALMHRRNDKYDNI